MNALAIIQLVLLLLQGVAAAAQKQGMTDVVTAASNAVNELTKVHGSEVSKGQLDSLRVQPLW